MAWFERHFDIIAYQLEVVALVLLILRALVWVDTMGPAMEFLAVGASVFFWLVVFVLLLFLMSPMQLGMLGLFTIASAEFSHLLQQIAVGASTVCQFGVLRIGVTIHHRLEV